MLCLQIEAVEFFWNILNIEIGMSVPKTAKFLIMWSNYWIKATIVIYFEFGILLLDPLSNNFDHCQSKNWHARSKWFLKFTLNTNGLLEPSFGFFVPNLDLGEKYFQQCFVHITFTFCSTYTNEMVTLILKFVHLSVFHSRLQKCLPRIAEWVMCLLNRRRCAWAEL